ncbi:MAG TPA: family 20 glycosylhydrolase [Candidatus Limnocylindrales bacterium]|nr:family 20 glycosylhydrolase [Candidatus Limnocylindrales bacterium]
MRTLLCLPLLAAASLAADAPALMPMPATVRFSEGGVFPTAIRSTRPDPQLEAAITRFRALLARETGIDLALQPASATPYTITIETAAAAPAWPELGEDEAYTLDISPAAGTLRAATTTGALRGLATLAQLVTPGPSGFQIPCVHIEDRPRFPWRGLMMDSARHFMPLEVVLRNIDAMAAVKLNVFHWHLADDQGFRAESKLYPRLQEMGSDGRFYTQAQMREVVEYARQRGIRVVPEFDIPGHTLSWFPGYPELNGEPGTFQIARRFGVFDPVMDPTRDELYTFLDRFLGEMAALFPDRYFHVGGDEVNGKQWRQSPHVQEFMKQHNMADFKALQVYFNQRLSKIMEKHGKIMIGWDEVLQPDLPQSTVIQSWRGPESLAEAAQKGYRGILSAGYYLDHLRPASYHYSVDPLSGAAANLTPQQSQLILGGEACMWAELVDAETVDSRIWPRAAAIAERFWSPKETTDVDSMYARVEAVSRRLAWTGVQHRAVKDPMLDRLTGGHPEPSLHVLADASEALGLGPRRGGQYNTWTPLNKFVDAVPPESESVRRLELAARRLSAGDTALLRQRFTVWAANDARFQPLTEGNSFLAGLKSLSKDLSALGAAGLQALDYLANHQTPPAGWITQQQAEFKRMLKPNAEVTLAAVRPVQILVEALAKP